MELLDEIAWMDETMAKLRADVDERGPITTGVNGNGFEVTSENPAMKSYNQLVRNYTSAVKQLRDMLPDAAAGEADELQLFLRQN